MPQPDTHQRFIFDNSNIRGEIVRLDESFQSIMQQHHYPNMIFNLLGECIVSAVLLSSVLKYDGQLTVQFQSDGAIKMLVAKCDESLHIRGLAQYKGPLPRKTTSPLANGQLIVTISQDRKVVNYQSIIPLTDKPIAENLEDYFSKSVQIPTKIWLSISKKSATGILLQLLPGKERSTKQREEFWQQAEKIETLTQKKIQNLDNIELLKSIYPHDDIRLFDEDLIQFRCQCSQASMENVIRMIGKNETDEILAEKKVIEITCEYCNTVYAFDRNEVNQLLVSKLLQ